LGVSRTNAGRAAIPGAKNATPRTHQRVNPRALGRSFGILVGKGSISGSLSSGEQQSLREASVRRLSSQKQFHTHSRPQRSLFLSQAKQHRVTQANDHSFFWVFRIGPPPTHGQGVGSNQTKHHQHLTALGPRPCSTHIPSGPPCWGPLHRLALILVATASSWAFLVPLRCGQAAAVGWDASDRWNREDGLPTPHRVAPRPGTTRPARIAPRLGSLESGGWPPNPNRGRSPGQARHAQPGSPLLGPQSRRKAQCPL
jgi:hypothetical protein